MLKHLIKLARPAQWTKSGFVLIGPLYALADKNLHGVESLWGAFWAAAAFALMASSCYALNDVRDAEQDRVHPRKRKRPVACGAITPSVAIAFGAALNVAAFVCLLGVKSEFRLWTGLMLAAYLLTTIVYTVWLKQRVIADVIGLALGFVLRVLGGCAAVGIGPTTWLLTATFFLSMFLAFGKRLGERRTLGDAAVSARSVQDAYSDDTLRLAVMATGVVTLVTYAFYIVSQDAKYTFHVARTLDGTPTGFGFNLMWLTVLPATYALLRCVVLLEQGRYDDPTELAISDRAFQLAAGAFVLLAGGLMYARSTGQL
ncbi:MAG: UbiA prenyltransferase family protein [Phycisphaerales bacterium]|nr:UbiA prenyltransferase family protein [Phycisphaerales bacterium]